LYAGMTTLSFMSAEKCSSWNQAGGKCLSGG
jgi:hypothetical protein